MAFLWTALAVVLAIAALYGLYLFAGWSLWVVSSGNRRRHLAEIVGLLSVGLIIAAGDSDTLNFFLFAAGLIIATLVTWFSDFFPRKWNKYR